jgi:hypothetical protein
VAGIGDTFKHAMSGFDFSAAEKEFARMRAELNIRNLEGQKQLLDADVDLMNERLKIWETGDKKLQNEKKKHCRGHVTPQAEAAALKFEPWQRRSIAKKHLLRRLRAPRSTSIIGEPAEPATRCLQCGLVKTAYRAA